MTSYDQIIDAVNSNCAVKIHREDRGIGMDAHHHPISITEREFNHIRDFIVRNNLKCGYEVATGVGLSALAAGLGFKETGGKLITLDAYIEEQHNDATVYREARDMRYADADGYKLVTYLLKHYQIDDIVTAAIGWSPTDTAAALAGLNGERLDYVFLDAGHWDEALIADVESIADRLADRFVVFMHDMHCFGAETLQRIGERLNGTPTLCFPPDDTTYNLFYVATGME